MSAYSDLYLSDAMRNLGGMLDFAVNDCSISMGTFLECLSSPEKQNCLYAVIRP